MSETVAAISPAVAVGPWEAVAEPRASPDVGGDLRGLRLHEAVTAQAARTPDACAILFEDASYSFAWLEDRAALIASHLAAAGVRPGDVVGVHLERSPDMVAALLGCLRAGGAYLPLDPGFPTERLQMVVADAGPVAVLTERALVGTLPLPAGGPQELVLEACRGAQTAGPVLDGPVREVAADDLAYVLYTSGSTGRPKGVEIPHRAVMNLLASFIEEPGFTPEDRMLAATTTAFDISVIEIFLPLVIGAQMVLASRSCAKDPQRLGALIDDEGCTIAQATPSLWRFLLDSGWRGRAGLTILAGGEPLPRKLADRLLAAGRTVWNVYGPTETTVWSTIGRVEAGDEPVSIGRPIAETTLHVLDASGAPVADGETGELHIGGAGLARGYRGQPHLTRERFALHRGERLYRTGDLARRRPDGAYECLGRTDQQVKIRGFRVELGDVEAALTALPPVADAAVLARPGPSEALELVAFVSARADADFDPVGLREGLARKLPAYMVPSRFVRLDSLPLTPNGKIDRRALPDMAPSAAPEAIPADGLAATETESRLAEVWAVVLGLPAVSRTDNFFDLGGYSLLTVALLQRIRETFGRTLSMAALFSANDLAAMAALIDAPEGAEPYAIPLQPLGRRPPLIWLDAGPQLRPLAARLAPDQPLFGVNLDLSDEAEFGDGALDVPLLAARLVRKIRRFRPQGPYYLGGWCRWGAVAHAAARQLKAEGDEVALLVLLDAVNHASAYQAFVRLKETARGRNWARDPRRLGFGERVEIAALRFRPQRYEGDALLLRASDADRDWDGCSGWSDAIEGRLTVRDLPGDHRSVLAPPFVDALAAELRTALVRAQG